MSTGDSVDGGWRLCVRMMWMEVADVDGSQDDVFRWLWEGG